MELITLRRYRGRGHWFSPPVVQFIDGSPQILTTPPDLWPGLPESLALSSSASSDGWSLAFPSFQDIYDTKTRLSSPLADYYRQHIRSTLTRLTEEQGRKFGALVMEPVCLGAGGMVFVDPLFQACMVEVCRSSSDLFAGASWTGGPYEDELASLPSRSTNEWRGLPVVYDEGTLSDSLSPTSSSPDTLQSSPVFIASVTTPPLRYYTTLPTSPPMRRS